MIASEVLRRSARLLCAIVSLLAFVFVAMLTERLVTGGHYLSGGLALGMNVLLFLQTLAWGAHALAPGFSQARFFAFQRWGFLGFLVASFAGQVADATRAPLVPMKLVGLPVSLVLFWALYRWVVNRVR